MSRKRFFVGALALGAVVSVAYAAYGVFELSPADNWENLEGFKAGLPKLLEESQGGATEFNVVELGSRLGRIQIDGMHVCAHEEIAADQYVKLSAIADSLADNPGVSLQLRSLLESSSSVTDCQFRILEAATGVR